MLQPCHHRGHQPPRGTSHPPAPASVPAISRGRLTFPGRPDPGCAQYVPGQAARSAFPQARGAHSNPLRSRERRFESCRGHSAGGTRTYQLVQHTHLLERHLSGLPSAAILRHETPHSEPGLRPSSVRVPSRPPLANPPPPRSAMREASACTEPPGETSLDRQARPTGFSCRFRSAGRGLGAATDACNQGGAWIGLTSSERSPLVRSHCPSRHGA
jgi:hypothetical protein